MWAFFNRRLVPQSLFMIVTGRKMKGINKRRTLVEMKEQTNILIERERER